MHECITACKQYCLAAGATQGKIAYTQTVIPHWALQRGFPIAADFSRTESRKDRTHFIHFLRVYLLRVLQLDRSASGAFFGVSVAAPFR